MTIKAISMNKSRSKNKLAVMLIVVLAMLALAATAVMSPEAASAAEPAQAASPHVFFGMVTVDDQPAPQGTVIAAIVDGATVASVTVDAFGRYDGLSVAPADKTVTFTVDGLPANETATTQAGGATTLDLTASTTGQQQNAQPTSVAVPQTQDPTPASVQEVFRVGPTIRLRPVNDVIDIDRDGLIELLFRNPALNDHAMVVDLTVAIPSGFHLYGEGFATDTAAGAASATYSVPPGLSRTIYLNVKAEKTGSFTVHFSGNYWPEGNKDLFSPISLTHPFTVNGVSPNPANPDLTNPSQLPGAQPASTEAPAPAATAVPPRQDSDPSASCSLSPSGDSTAAGDMALLGLPLLGLAGLVGLRRRKGVGS